MSEYELRAPDHPDAWRVYHDIRRRVLWEARGQFGVYDENRPDEMAPGIHPRVLFFQGDAVGVIRIDVAGAEAIFRRVAVRAEAQRRGHGRAMLALAERFVRDQGCGRLASHVAPDAVEFYKKCGFLVVDSATSGSLDDPSVFMTKTL